MESNQNIREFVSKKTQEYDDKLASLEASIDELTKAIAVLSGAISIQASSITQFLSHWQQAVPIKLVFWLTALIVGGTASISIIRFLIPTL